MKQYVSKHNLVVSKYRLYARRRAWAGALATVRVDVMVGRVPFTLPTEPDVLMST